MGECEGGEGSGAGPTLHCALFPMLPQALAELSTRWYQSLPYPKAPIKTPLGQLLMPWTVPHSPSPSQNWPGERVDPQTENASGRFVVVRSVQFVTSCRQTPHDWPALQICGLHVGNEGGLGGGGGVVTLTMHGVVTLTMHGVVTLTMHGVVSFTKHGVVTLTRHGVVSLTMHGVVSLTMHGVVTLTMHGVVTLTKHGVVTLPMHGVVLLTRHGGVSLTRHGVVTLTMHGVVTLTRHGVVTLPMHGVVTLTKHGVVTITKHGVVTTSQVTPNQSSEHGSVMTL